MVVATATPGQRRVEHVMGMPILLDVRDEVEDGVIDAMFDWLRWVDATFSTFKENSEISRLGRGGLQLVDAHPDVQRVLERCETLRVETTGYFDVHASGSLDPSGFVKGWSIDRAAAFLHGEGLHNFALNAGGDVVLSGRAVPDLHWRVGIQHPVQRDKIAALLEVNDLAIATSGAYERGDHVIDPHTGEVPADLLSVTVVGPALGIADAYATAAFAMGGEAAAHWTARLRGYEAMTILANETVFTTPGFPAE